MTKNTLLTLTTLLVISSYSIASDLESDINNAINIINHRNNHYEYTDSDARLPEIGTASAQTISTQEEMLFGHYFYKKARQYLNIIDDPVLSEYIETLGNKLVSNANNVRFPFKFFLVLDPTLNAAAFLGGNVKVNSGLFQYSDNESQLASVLAHEITHVTQRHLARYIDDANSRTMKTLGAIVGSLILAIINPELGMAAINTTLALNMQSSINYTRNDELEADHIGINLMYRSGFEPGEMAVFFNKLTGTGYKGIPQNLIDHPIPEIRVADARMRAVTYPNFEATKNINFYFAKARVFVRFSDNSPTFCIEHFSKLLKHNNIDKYEMAYLLYGLTLAYIAKKDYANASKTFAKLQVDYKNNLFILDTFSDLELLRNNTSCVINVLTERLKFTPNNSTILLNLAVAYRQAGKKEKCVEILESLHRNEPENLLALEMLTEIYKSMNKKMEYYIANGKKFALLSDYTNSNKNYHRAYQYVTSKLDKAKINALIVLNENNRKIDKQFEDM